MTKRIILALVMLTTLACHQHRAGPLERAGERSDEIIDNAEKGKPLLHKKGALEKAGESVDETLGLDRDRR